LRVFGEIKVFCVVAEDGKYMGIRLHKTITPLSFGETMNLLFSAVPALRTGDGEGVADSIIGPIEFPASPPSLKWA
jgi:hypothetical protein